MRQSGHRCFDLLSPAVERNWRHEFLKPFWQRTAPLPVRINVLGLWLCAALFAFLIAPESARAGDFTFNWGGVHDWPVNSTGPVTVTMTDQYGFQLTATMSISRSNGSAVSGYPDNLSGFGTNTSVIIAWDPNWGSSGIGESTNTATLSFSSGGSPFAVNSLSFQVTDIDATDNNKSSDRCDFITATGNNGNPSLSYVSSNATARSVRIGPATGSGSTGALASNQAQCIYNTGTTSSNTSNADDYGSIVVTYPSLTSTATIAYDESIENVYGVTSRDAAARGVGVWGATAVVVDTSISLTKSTSASSFFGSGETITYTYTVTNTGRLPLSSSQNIVISDDKIGEFVCATGALAVGANVQCTANYTTTAGDASAGSVTNNATAGVGSIGQSFASRLHSTTESVTVPRVTDFSCPTGSTATGSGYASSGSGALKDQVFWLDWNCSGNNFLAGGTYTKSWSLPDGITVTGVLTNISLSLTPYNTTTWSGNILDDYYGGVNPIGLAPLNAGDDSAYRVSYTASKNGISVPLEYVLADAEFTDAGSENLQASTTGSAFELLETVGSSSVSGIGTTSATITSGGGGTSLISTQGSPVINASYLNNGGQALAYGIRLRRDFSDAPTASLGGASHLILSLWRLGAGVTNESADYNDANAAGDADDGVVLPAMVQGMPATIPVAVTGTGGYLQAWMDWDGDGSFGGAGEQVASNVQDGGAGDGDGSSNGTIQLQVTVPPGAATTQTFARFRWSTSTGVGPSSASGVGEVEDYAFTVTAGAPALAVSKVATFGAGPTTADGTTDNVAAGTAITYTYTITNTGNQSISSISMNDVHNGSGSDPVPDPDTAVLTDNGTSGDSTNTTTGDGRWDVLGPGDTLTLTATYTVTQQDVDQLQ